jgi:hypothetical protein
MFDIAVDSATSRWPITQTASDIRATPAMRIIEVVLADIMNSRVFGEPDCRPTHL